MKTKTKKNLPYPFNQVMTIGVQAFLNDTNTSPALLWQRVIETYQIQPDECLDGGNDKSFFTIKIAGEKMFVARNEANGLTVMLPDEY